MEITISSAITLGITIALFIFTLCKFGAQYGKLDNRVNQIEKSTESAHKRIDTIVEKHGDKIEALSKEVAVLTIKIEHIDKKMDQILDKLKIVNIS